MQLHSNKMALSSAERHWLPWFGKTSKLTMRWAYRCNRDRVEAMESAFNSFATTRQALLVAMVRTAVEPVGQSGGCGTRALAVGSELVG